MMMRGIPVQPSLVQPVQHTTYNMCVLRGPLLSRRNCVVGLQLMSLICCCSAVDRRGGIIFLVEQGEAAALPCGWRCSGFASVRCEADTVAQSVLW
ncbi:unnamed protein product [Ectocarpus fasciculatus]